MLQRLNIFRLVDYIGLVASSLCFVHCWLLPIFFIFVPGLMINNKWVHPLLCGTAIMSTIPLVVKKTFGQHSSIMKFSVVLGNILMLITLLLHEGLSFRVEVLLNTIGGLCLTYVHYRNIKMKKESCHSGIQIKN